jgi:hypothetical protein
MSKAEPYTPEQMISNWKLLSALIRERGLLATIAERDRRIAELEKDGKRLDWLLTHRGMSVSEPNQRGEVVMWDQRLGLVVAARGNSPREAIDAAMEADRG